MLLFTEAVHSITVLIPSRRALGCVQVVMRVVSRVPQELQREHQRHVADSRLEFKSPLREGALADVDRSVLKLVAYKKQILWDALDALGDPDQGSAQEEWTQV